MPSVLRSILAVIAGFLTMNFIVIVLTLMAVALMHLKSGNPTPGYLVFNVAYSFFAAVAGGAVTALIARRKPIEHGAVLAAIMLAFGVFSYRHYSGMQPLWYQWMMIAGSPLCAIAGAAIVARGTSSSKLSRQ